MSRHRFSRECRYTRILTDDLRLWLQIDSATLEILNPKLTALVTLTAADRKWMDEIVTLVDQSWNAADPARPLGQGFVGSDDFIRAKFEEYVCSLLACVKFGDFLSKERGERVEMLLSAPGESFSSSSRRVCFFLPCRSA